jgi:hypothetical protein
MDWSIRETEVLYSVADVGLHVKPFPDGKVLYRSDTLAPLSVVGKRYSVVQPRDVLEFYRDLVSAGGFELETAGVLKAGRKLWALPKTGQETILKGGDKVKAYLLLGPRPAMALWRPRPSSLPSASSATLQQHAPTGGRRSCRCRLRLHLGPSVGF